MDVYPTGDSRTTLRQAFRVRAMTRQLEILFERCVSLLFGMEAFRDGPNDRIIRRIRFGMFFAPCQALTARHVVTDLHNVNPTGLTILQIHDLRSGSEVHA